MSGYLGNPDAESEQALILSENGINASRALLDGPVLEECLDCGEQINPLRVAYMRQQKMKCIRCLSCQQTDDLKPKQRIKMLDRIL